MGYLNEVFEDAKFIHIVRDGRAVASSLLHVSFGVAGMVRQGWRAGLLSPEDQATWESYGRSFVALAGLEWRIQMRAIEAARRQLDPARYFEVKYESFCDEPLETYHRVLDFAELPRSAAFDRDVRTRRSEARAIGGVTTWRPPSRPSSMISCVMTFGGSATVIRQRSAVAEKPWPAEHARGVLGPSPHRPSMHRRDAADGPCPSAALVGGRP